MNRMLLKGEPDPPYLSMYGSGALLPEVLGFIGVKGCGSWRH